MLVVSLETQLDNAQTLAQSTGSTTKYNPTPLHSLNNRILFYLSHPSRPPHTLTHILNSQQLPFCEQYSVVEETNSRQAHQIQVLHLVRLMLAVNAQIMTYQQPLSFPWNTVTSLLQPSHTMKKPRTTHLHWKPVFPKATSNLFGTVL